MIKPKHNNITDNSVRVENQNFNQNFIKKFTLDFDINKFERPNLIDKKKSTLKDNNPFQTVWFKNIDRLIEMIPDKINLLNYNLLDVGSGLGFSTFYFKENYKFKSYQGFDFDYNLVQLSKKILETNYNNNSINFFKADASDFILNYNDPYVIFIFNSFGKDTLNKFIKNNIECLKKNDCIILYCNDHHYNEIKDYKEFYRNEYYNLSTIIF